MKYIRILTCLLVFFSCKESNTTTNYLDFQGAKIHYKTSGNGNNNLLFIHGWGCDLNAWKYQEAYFKSDARVILMDLPGFGKSSKQDREYTIDLFANSVIKVMDELQIKQVHLIGHSLGHPIVKRIAQLKPNVVSTISIVDGVYFNFPTDPNEKKDYKEQLNQFASMFSGEARIPNTKAFINSLYIEETPQEIREYTDTTMMRVAAHIGSNVMQNLIEEDLWTAGTISAKTLAIYANIPELPSNNDSILRAWYPNLEYVEMDSVGHFLMMEKPQLFNEILSRFIQEN